METLILVIISQTFSSVNYAEKIVNQFNIFL